MFFEHKFCEKCDSVTGHYDGKCGKCLDKQSKEKERMWEAQDISTKITDLRKRIEMLERGPARY